MRITEIGAKNFKGQTFAHRLAPVTLFHGPNFAGKSARVEALTLLLASYLPSVGKKPSDLHARLASGQSMLVTGTTDSNEILVRSWEENDGSVKAGYSGPQQFAAGVPAVSVDASEFLGLSAAERVRFMFAAAEMDSLKTGAVAKELRKRFRMLVSELESPGEDSVKAIENLVATCDGIKGGIEAQRFVESVAAEVRQLKLTTDEMVKRMQKTGQGLTQIGDIAPVNIAAEAKLDKARRKLAEAGSQANLRDLERKAQEAAYELRRAATMDEQAKSNVAAAVEALKSAKAKRTCPECGQPLSAELKRKLVGEAEGELATAKEEAVKAAKDLVAETEAAGLEAKALEREREKIEKSFGPLRRAVEEAERDYKALMAFRAEQKAKADAAVRAKSAAAELEVYKAAVKAVVEYQSELVAKAAGPVLARANELCAPILRVPLEWADGDICMRRYAGGPLCGTPYTWTWRSFSGTEKALAFCALQVALATGSPLRLAVLDEMGRLDRRNKLNLVSLMVNLVRSRKLDNVVLVDTEPLQGCDVLDPKVYTEVEVKP